MTDYQHQLFEPLWEAWVDDESSDQCILYVVGEVHWNGRGKSPRLYIVPHSADSRELHLEVSFGTEGGGVLTEVIYSQPLLRKHQYQTISIYSNGHLLVKWRRIESMRVVAMSGDR